MSDNNGLALVNTTKYLFYHISILNISDLYFSKVNNFKLGRYMTPVMVLF